jgi:hypothetical protein
MIIGWGSTTEGPSDDAVREMLVRALEAMPLEMLCRNDAALREAW